MAIHEDPAKAWALTIESNTVAVVSDGTAVLGLGDIGPAPAMPVMEGKAMLFKEFAGVDGFPLCIGHQGRRRDRRLRRGCSADLRRHRSRGHRRAALL
jgi:malic enzyme